MRVAGVVGSTLGTLGNMALTWEGETAKIAGRFGMAGSLVCTFLDLLFPPQDPPPPVTKQDLSEALGKSETNVINGLWLDKASNTQVDIETFSTKLNDKWLGMTKMVLETKKDSQGHVVAFRPVIAITDALDPTALDEHESYYYPKGGSEDKLENYRLKLETPVFNDANNPPTPVQLAQRRLITKQLYVLVGGLVAGYYQASVAWRWGKEMLLAQQVTDYRADHDNWAAQNANYQALNPEADLLNPYPDLKKMIADTPDFETSYSPPTWKHWSTQDDSPVAKLKECLDELLAFSLTGKPADGATPAKPGFYTELRQNWDALEDAVANPDPALTPSLQVPAGSKGTLNQMVFAMTEGQRRAAAWSDTVAAKELMGITEDDVLGFGQAVDAWRTLRAAVSFYEYTTVTNAETLTSVATDQYGDGSLAAQVAKYNPDIKQGVNAALPLGTTLKIFEKAWLPYVDLAKELWPRPQVAPPAN